MRGQRPEEVKYTYVVLRPTETASFNILVKNMKDRNIRNKLVLVYIVETVLFLMKNIILCRFCINFWLSRYIVYVIARSDVVPHMR
jgi:hypothetical protein